MFKAISEADETSDHRQHSKDHERSEHHPGTLVRLSVAMGIAMAVTTLAVRVGHRATVVAGKRHVHQPEHIEGGNESGHDANQPIHRAGAKRFPKNFVLRPETG